MKKLFHYLKTKSILPLILLLGGVFSVSAQLPAADREPAVQGPQDTNAGNEEAALEKALQDETRDQPVSSESNPSPANSRKSASAKKDDAAAIPETNDVASATPGALTAAAANVVTNLEFKMEGDVSRIVISFKDKPVFHESRNLQVKQIVYLFDNTSTPNQFQRAYDTSDFPSPISLFTLLQMPNAEPSVSKLIVQLRDDKSPTVTANDSTMTIDFPAPAKSIQIAALAKKDDPAQVEENIYAGGKTFSGKRINKLEIKNSDIQDVLRLIAKTSGYNIVVGDDVSGKVGTLSLDNIPWDQAFTLILQSKKLGYVRQGNVLRVGTLTSLKSEKEEALANENARVKVEPLRTALIPISYAKASDLAARGKQFLTERGAIEVDARTNTVIVKDVEKVVNRVQKLLAALDTQSPSVSISAKMMEMSEDFTRSIGFSMQNFNPSLGGINIAQTFTSGISAGSVTTISAPNFLNLNSVLQLGEIDNRVKTLANPQVTTVANQPATVTQSISFFLPTTTIVAGAGPTISQQQYTATLSLTVTPIVSGDGTILLQINMQNQVPEGPLATRTINGRTVQTEVLLENGDTAVMGGVFNDTITIDKEGIPFLSSIPILGFFFQGNSFEDNKNEIYMFITAKILNAEESFKRTL
jgi:type IV pilus assembly protein PilQ